MKTIQSGSVLDSVQSFHGDMQAVNFLNSIPALFAYVDKDLRYQYINTAYGEWSGANASSIVGKTVSEVLGEDVFIRIKPYINIALSGKKAHFENTIYNKDGLRHLDVFLTPDFDVNKTVKGYTVLINDVTEKKKTEKELYQKKEELQDYVDNAAIAMHWVNADGIITWANQAELKMLGYARDEYIGHHISEFHADNKIITEILDRLACNETLNQYEAILRCKNGSIRHVIINSNVLWEDGKFIHTRCFTLDITEKKLIAERLRESEAHYRQLLEGLPVAVYTCDQNGYIQLYNKAAVDLFGRAPQPGKDLWRTSWGAGKTGGITIPFEEIDITAALKEARNIFGEEIIIERPDGSKRTILPYPQPIFNAAGKVTGGINVVIDITAQKLAAKALKESETRYRHVVNGLPAAVYTCDAQGRILLYNKTAADLWGREPQIGKDLWCGSWKIYQTDGKPLPLDTCPMAIALKEGRVVVGEEIIIERPDGTRRNVAPHPQPLFDEAGNVTGAVNMLLDITDQKHAEQALRESEERFRTIASLAPTVIWMADVNGSWTYLNKEWSEITGKASAEGYGSGWTDFLHPADKETVCREWRRVLSAQEVYTLQFRYLSKHQDYLIVKATGTPKYNPDGAFVGYIGILQDITMPEHSKLALEREITIRTQDLLNKNEELRKSEERYHRMVAEVQDYAIILLSKDGIIENWNKGAEKLKGYQAREVVGRHFSLFYTREDQQIDLPSKMIAEAARNGKAVLEGWRVRKDGSTFWGSIVITALHDEDNNVIGFSKVTRDLTERKSAEDALRANAVQLQKKNTELERMNEELTSFAYVSSHDLQEPLRKIQTFATRIQELEVNNLSDKGKDYFNRIQNAAFRMQGLIEDLLMYSRASTPETEFESTDLNILLKEVQTEIKEAIEEKRAVIESSTLPQMKTIVFQFRQLLINLLSNSLKFSKQGITPHIIINTEIVTGDKVPASPVIDPQKSFHHITIADNGIGFDPRYNKKIFEVFQRLHGKAEYAGTGIGLAICKRIVENHEGIITADGVIGEGAIFHIYIPISL